MANTRPNRSTPLITTYPFCTGYPPWFTHRTFLATTSKSKDTAMLANAPIGLITRHFLASLVGGSG